MKKQNNDFNPVEIPPLPTHNRSVGPFIRKYFKEIDKKRIAQEYRRMQPGERSQKELAERYHISARSLRKWVKKYAPDAKDLEGLIDTNLDDLIRQMEITLTGLKELRARVKDPIGPTRVKMDPAATEPLPKFNFND